MTTPPIPPIARKKRTPPRRVALSLDMNFGFRRHLEIYAGCQRYADEAGWDCSIQPAIDQVLMKNGELQFDGILARVNRPMAEIAWHHEVPIVNVWLNSPVADEVPSVLPDFEEAGAMAAQHLLGRGFRNFGFLGYLRDIDTRLGLRGFRSVTRKHGFRCSPFRCSRTADEGKARGWTKFIGGMEDWIDSWETPIGIFAGHDLLSRYVIDLCRAKDLHVSQQVAIVGTSNEPVICEAPPPTLTSIDLNMAKVGYEAAALLDRLMDGEPPPGGSELVSPSELVPRQSTDSFAATDPLVSRALRFIAEHGQERIQVKDVAAAVATTRRTLERRFRDSLGRSIAGEITRLRIERAKRRMVETDAAMKDVAIDAGFRSADHFYKVFSRVEGIPPSNYREQHQKRFTRPGEDS